MDEDVKETNDINKGKNNKGKLISKIAYMIFSFSLIYSGMSILIASTNIVNNIALFGQFNGHLYGLYFVLNGIALMFTWCIGLILGISGLMLIREINSN